MKPLTETMAMYTCIIDITDINKVEISTLKSLQNAEKKCVEQVNVDWVT